MDLYSLSPDERKRLLNALAKDPIFSKRRNLFLAASVISAICLSVVGWLVTSDMAPMWVALAVISTCVLVYVFFAFRFMTGRNAALTRLTQPKPQKKEKKERPPRQSRAARKQSQMDSKNEGETTE